MIYQALYELAQREKLVEDPAFVLERVHHLVVIGEDGIFLNLESPREAPPLDPRTQKPKGVPLPPRLRVPKRSGRTSAVQEEFLVDKAEYVFGIDPKGERKTMDLEKRQRAYLHAIESADQALGGHVGLQALLTFLQRPLPVEVKALLHPEKKAELITASGALFAFRYQPYDGMTPLHLQPEVMQYWRNRMASTETDLYGQCLVTGMPNQPLTRLHANFKGVPPRAVTKGGVGFTSVNSDAFVSYDLKAIGCAPISIGASQAIEAAMTRLLDPAYPAPEALERETPTLEKQCISLSPDTVLVFWSQREATLSFMDMLDSPELQARHSDEVQALFRQALKGRRPALEDPTAFYGLILSGTQGRAILRSYLQTTVAQVAANMAQSLQELEILRPFGRGNGLIPWHVMRRSLAAREELERLPPSLNTDLFLSVLLGRPWPRTVLEAAVRRNRAELFPLFNGQKKEEPLAARCALIKAYLIRNVRKEIPVSLDVNRTESAYLMGRLLAELDKIQADALGNVNASIIDRYYGSASSTPASVFPTLMRRAQNHLSKLRKEKTGWAVNHEKLLQSILANLSSFPRTLNLEEQGLFTLGFYHQRQDFFSKRETSTPQADA